MILSIPLQPDTELTNVRYKFIVGTVEGVELSTGITQPDAAFPVFLFDVTLPDGITEVVAYDLTDNENWNVAGLSGVTGETTPSPVSPAPPEVTRLIAISTPYRVPFRKVFDGALRLHGIDPKGTKSQDIAASLVEHINSRVDTISLAWPWPEWTVTEERAFRQVWSASRQFYRRNEIGQADEVFYIPTFSYWRANPTGFTDPVIGVPPSVSNASWIPIDPLDAYIAYNQTCKRAIGQVLGVYRSDPRRDACCNGSTLRYKPSEHGIDVCGGGLTTVFILYQMPSPSYTMTPFVPGRTYVRGDVIFDGGTGECFQAVDTTTKSPNEDLTVWRHVPFLQKWYDFVRWGAYADSLWEIDQGNSFDSGLKANNATKAEERAMEALQRQVDSLTMQGQKMIWDFGKTCGCWCDSIRWNGGNVTTLTDECESSTGFIFPVPPSPLGIHWEWHPEIVSLRTTAPSLAGFPTLTWAPYSKIEIAIDEGTGLENSEWRLRTGEADPLDLEGKVAPDDYDPVSNNKHWERLGA